MHDLFPACNCLIRPEGLISNYYTLYSTSESTKFPRKPRSYTRRINRIYLGSQGTTTTCNVTPTARLPKDSSPRGRGSMDDDLGRSKPSATLVNASITRDNSSKTSRVKRAQGNRNVINDIPV